MEKRTSAAKAGYGRVIYGTAEAVPFQDRVLAQALKPKDSGWFMYGLKRLQKKSLLRVESGPQRLKAGRVFKQIRTG